MGVQNSEEIPIVPLDNSSEDQPDAADFDRARKDQEFSVNEFVNLHGFGPYQWVLFAVCILSWMADGMKPIIISYLLTDEENVLEKFSGWQISSIEKSILASSIFVGMFFGTILWGKWADIYGRKIILFITVLLTFLLSSVASLSPNIIFLIISEFVLGFAVGGNLPVVTSLFLEYLPLTNRGFWLTILATSWSFGELVVTFCAWLFLNTEHGWRGLIFTAGVPGLIACLFWGYVQESPRYLIAKQKVSEAKHVLDKLHERNGKWSGAQVPAQWELVGEDVDQDELGSFRAIFAPSIWRHTAKVWTLWLLGGVGFYGLLLYLPSILGKRGFSVKQIATVAFVSSFGNLGGRVSAAFLVETRLKRRGSMALLMALSGLGTLLLAFSLNIYATTFCAALAKYGLYGFWAVLDSYTPESYPTTIRSYANSVANAVVRVSAFVSPFFNQFIIDFVNFQFAIVVWSVAALLAVIFAFMLSIETAELVLLDSVSQWDVSAEPSSSPSSPRGSGSTQAVELEEAKF